jgi:hypothetical protein
MLDDNDDGEEGNVDDGAYRTSNSTLEERNDSKLLFDYCFLIYLIFKE